MKKEENFRKKGIGVKEEVMEKLKNKKVKVWEAQIIVLQK